MVHSLVSDSQSARLDGRSPADHDPTDVGGAVVQTFLKMSNTQKQLLVATALSLVTSDLAITKEVPMPRPKPSRSAAALQSPSYRPSVAPVPHILPPHNVKAWPSDCGLWLAGVARFSHQPTLNGPDQCGAANIVRLERIIMPNGTMVAISPPAILRCPMAEAVAYWVRSDLGPATAELNSSLAEITNRGSYECRGRNGVVGAKISEHGRGNAIDLGRITLRNGAIIDLTKQSAPQGFRQRLRDATCRRFKTVLGPGSDTNHVNHIHIDLIERKNGYRMCQWDVREPEPVAEVPIPQPKPVALRSSVSRCLSARPKRVCLR